MDKTEGKAIIMVVDDTPANLKLLNNMLAAEGYRVLTCPRGSLALTVAAKTPPDLVLLDIKMPLMDGFEVCKRFKSDPELVDIPVIFISALDDTSDKINAFAAGGVDYITKPFQFEEVHARVKAHLEISRQKAALHQSYLEINRQKNELELSYRKLGELEKLRDSLVHMIAHDMRSPLMSTLGYIELAQMDLSGEMAHNYIDLALQSTTKISAMISNLLDVSKMEEGQMKLDYSSFDIISLAKDTLKMVEPMRQNRSITFISKESACAVSADSNLVQRVLQNIISNAIKFTHKERGVITLSLENGVDGNLKVLVSDNGAGIPLEYHGRVFDKFFQVEGGKKVAVQSSGLGMAFCKLAVEAHGGTIGLESEVDKGTTFWFKLPLTPLSTTTY